MTLRGSICLIIATLTYGGMHVIDKAALAAGVTAPAYSVTRVFLAALMLFGITISSSRGAVGELLSKRTIKDLVIIGVLASGWGLLLQIAGLSYTSATNAGLLLTLVAPVTTFFAVIILDEPLTGRLVLATALMIAGVTSIYGLDQLRSFGRGDLLILLAVAGYGYSNVHARKTMRNLDVTLVTLGRLVFGALSIALLLPFFSFSFSSLIAAPFLVAAGGAVFGVRMVAYYKGIELEGASIAATFLLFSPAFTVLAARLFLGEALSGGVLLGILLSAAGGWALLGAGGFPSSAQRGKRFEEKQE